MQAARPRWIGASETLSEGVRGAGAAPPPPSLDLALPSRYRIGKLHLEQVLLDDGTNWQLDPRHILQTPSGVSHSAAQPRPTITVSRTLG